MKPGQAITEALREQASHDLVRLVADCVGTGRRHLIPGLYGPLTFCDLQWVTALLSMPQQPEPYMAVL